MELAPIAFFVYNRPDHTRKALNALADNTLASASDLFIYCDGPKTSVSIDEAKAIRQVREIARAETRFKTITIIEQEVNKGLAKSITGGIGELLGRYFKVIVLEDDLVTSPWFLQFLNDGLEKYETVSQVVCITGYIYPIKSELPATFFLNGADCWGWATWTRGWQIYNHDAKVLLGDINKEGKNRKFDYDGTYPYTQMLKDNIDNKNNSWAIKWHASAFLQKKLTLYPGKSLVLNIGHDNSGTHSGLNSSFTGQLSNHRIILADIPIEPNEYAYKRFKKFFKSLQIPFVKRLINRILK